jgi:hypothetical protein
MILWFPILGTLDYTSSPGLSLGFLVPGQLLFYYLYPYISLYPNSGRNLSLPSIVSVL